MSEKKPLNIGLVGRGFMGRTHSDKHINDFFPDLQHRPVLKAFCGRNEERTKAFAAELSGYEPTESDWKALIARDDIDTIDICKPNDTHTQIAIAAAGSGVSGNLLAHCIDTAIWLNGGNKDVSAVTETFIKERVHTGTGEKQAVTIDDACLFHCHFNNGSLGLFESTRYARSHKALSTLKTNGIDASISWDLHDINCLEFCDHSDEGKIRDWRSIHISDGNQPYMDKWWVPGHCIGYAHTFAHQVADFLASLRCGERQKKLLHEGQVRRIPNKLENRQFCSCSSQLI